MTRAGGRRADLDGILLIDKPPGVSSAGVVRDVKRRLGGAKVGHLGTLDPFATGLLPLCVGEGSKVVPFLNQEDKAYEGVLRLGVATDTLDATGAAVEEQPVPEIGADRLHEVAARFTGSLEQVPPMFSALKQEGVPLYRLARKGVVVEREPRRITVHSLRLEVVGESRIRFEVACSKGTYVRVLGADIAEALGTVGHLESLRRTRFGTFRVEDAIPPGRAADPGSALIRPREALAGLRALQIDAGSEKELRQGRQAALDRVPPPRGAEEVACLVGPAGEMIALIGAESGRWRLLRVLAS